MIRRSTFLALAAMALFAVQAADCSSLFSAEHHAMTCCGSMPCHSSDGAHQCCKAENPRPAPVAVTPVSPACKIAPAAAAVLVAALKVGPASRTFSEFAAPQHSPPELYSLHSSLRI
jgi:hypothetical protein